MAHSTSLRVELAALKAALDMALAPLKGDPLSTSVGAHPGIYSSSDHSQRLSETNTDDVHGFKSALMQAVSYLHAIPHLEQRLLVRK